MAKAERFEGKPPCLLRKATRLTFRASKPVLAIVSVKVGDRSKAKNNDKYCK